MNLMTRSTKRNKIIKISMILSINISPLDYFRFFTYHTTIRTISWFAFISSYPLMKTTITNFFTFPIRMSLIFEKFCNFLIMFWGVRFMSYFISKRFTPFYKLFIPDFFVTFSGTKVAWLNFRERTPKYFFTSQTKGLYHKLIINTI